MNAGIADTADLSWMIAATLNGWAAPAIPNACLRGGATTDHRTGVALHDGCRIEDHEAKARDTPEIEWAGSIGERQRARIGKEAYDIDHQQQCAGGLNFGYFYKNSPIIAYDGALHPPTACRAAA